MEVFRIKDAISKLVDKLEGWLDSFITMLPNFVVAVLILFLFIFIARLLRNIIKRPLSRMIANPTITNIISSMIHLAVILTGFFIALDILDLDKAVTSLLAGVGIAGLAFGFAFKEAASNFISGIYMAIKSPMNEGDLIAYDEDYGIIKSIGLRATKLTTLQGQIVVIPNRLLMENRFTHFSINKERRIDLAVGISYGDDLEKAEKVTLEAIKKIDYLKEDKPVDFYYTAFGSSSIDYVIRYWVHFNKETDYLQALSDGIKNIKKAYDQHDITITFPIRTLDFGIKGGKTLTETLREVDFEGGEKNNSQN